MTKNVSRRSVAKGALWATPAVAVAASAPALAASGPATVTSTVCNLFYGTGDINHQAHTIFFGFTSTTDTIPAGTIITHQVCVDPSSDPAGGTTWNIPQNYYSGAGTQTWNITFTDAGGNSLVSGTQMTGKQCFNVVYTFTGDTKAADLACLTGIIWNDTATLRPASKMTVTTDSAVSGATNGGSSVLTYQAARRYPSAVNTKGRVANTFTSATGLQSCYPSVTWSQAISITGADDVVCYPSGTNITTARCAWTNGTSLTCTANATGLCTPAQKSGAPGQITIPSTC